MPGGTVTVYGFEDAEGTPDSFTTFDAIAARERAQQYRLKLIAYEYEYADSELIEDFTVNQTEGD